MKACFELTARRMRSKRGQQGSTAVEFAMIFPLFFIVLYGIITFSMIFVAQQSLTLAAAEGARAALRYVSSDNATDALAARVSNVCPTASSMLATMVASAKCKASSAPCNSGMQCVNVVLSYSYTNNPLVPSLPLLGHVLPNTLSSTATIQLNPVNLL